MDLTYPDPGSTTLRDLVPRVMTQLVQRYLALTAGEEGTLRRAAYDAARGARGRTATAIGDALMAPAGSAMLAAAERGEKGASDELDLLVLWELAAAGALAAPVVAPRPAGGWPRLPLLRQRVVVDVAQPVAALDFGDDRVAVAGGDGGCAASAPARASQLEVTTAFVEISDGVMLALVDDNPLASVQLHPERRGNALDLAGRDAGEWVAALREALAIIAEFLPELYDEMRWLLRVVVPVGYHEERHASCSYEDAIGAVYLTLHPRTQKLAEAIVHEYQHNKLHAVMRLDPLLRDGSEARHESPVRPDLRPLPGVLLAVHAFLPVARMYRAITASGHPWSKSRDWPDTCATAEAVHREGAATLRAHARPTKLGRALLDEMRALAEPETSA